MTADKEEPQTQTAAKLLQSCPTLCDSIEGSQPGFPSLGFSRQEHWSGLPFPSPSHFWLHFILQLVGKQKVKVKSESEVAQSCPTLFDPMDCSLPGSSVHGIFQARVLENEDLAQTKNKLKRQEKKMN